MKPNLVYWLLAADTDKSLLATWAIKGIVLQYPGVPPVQIYWLLSADTLTVNICLLSIALHLSNLSNWTPISRDPTCSNLLIVSR